jgi:hypothetical protein
VINLSKYEEMKTKKIEKLAEKHAAELHSRSMIQEETHI